MVAPFLTKKAKKEMLERRRRKKQSITAPHDDNEHDPGDEQQAATVKSRKRPRPDAAASHDEGQALPAVTDQVETTLLEQAVDSSDIHQAAAAAWRQAQSRAGKNVVVVIPTTFGSEQKKFRKIVRREAKRHNVESELSFVTQEEYHQQKKRKLVKQPKTFPVLNQLVAQAKQQHQQQATTRPEKLYSSDYTSRFVALDCEMVGTGVGGTTSVLARVSLVDWHGAVLLDTYVKVPDRVTDFRTWVSGVTPRHLQAAMDAAACRRAVTDLVRDKILVGHALQHDLKALFLTHPPTQTRDTAKYPPYQRLGSDGKRRPAKLRDLVQTHLTLSSFQQPGEAHDSVQDAAAAMELYKRVHEEWERMVAAAEQKKKRQK
jgi:RNA exonuclease 4